MSKRESWWRAISCSCMILRLFRPMVVTPFVMQKDKALRCGYVEQPCCLFYALESRSAEVRERYRGSMDPNVEGSLLYSHALSLVRSIFVTSYILDVGRERGENALSFSLCMWRCAGLTSTAADFWMSKRESCCRAVSCSCMILRLFRPVVVTPFVERKGGVLRCRCVERPCYLFCALESWSTDV